MEAQEVGPLRAQTRQNELLEPEQGAVDEAGVHSQSVAALKSVTARIDALEAEENERVVAEPCAGDPSAVDADAPAEGMHVLGMPTNDVLLEEDETQLAAIRELTTRASARGIWLTLTEIAEATEFAEASISAQLRHLRKAHHGGYHVEKRHRRAARGAGTMRRTRDARRGPVIWEYLVLPPA